MIKIGAVKKRTVNDRARISANIDIDGVSRSLFFETGQNNAQYLCDETADGFLVGLLISALQKHSDIYLETPVSERLLYGINNQLIPALVSMNSKFRSINIYPGKTSSQNHNRFNSVATPLSCGVDSFYTVLSNLDGKIPDSFRLTHLLLFNAGNFGLDQKISSAELNRQIENVSPVCDKLGLPLVWMDSNLMEFVKFPFEQVCTFCNVACAMVLQKLIKLFYYSSGHSISSFSLNFAYTDYYDLLNAGVLRTESFEMVSFGGLTSRFNKTREIDKNSICHEYLNVCVNLEKARRNSNRINCSSCFKCIRTMVSLDILGNLPNYEAVFDLKTFYRKKSIYWGKIRYRSWHAKDEFAIEILTKARLYGYRIPKLSYFWMLLTFISNQVKKKGLFDVNT